MESVGEHRLDKRLRNRLNKFEHEVEPYDRLSSIFRGHYSHWYILSIFIPILIIKVMSQSNPFVAIVSGSSLFWIVGQHHSNIMSYQTIVILCRLQETRNLEVKIQADSLVYVCAI